MFMPTVGIIWSGCKPRAWSNCHILDCPARSSSRRRECENDRCLGAGYPSISYTLIDTKRARASAPRFAHHRSRAHNCQVKSSFQRVVDSVRRRWRRRRRAVDEFVWFHVTSSRPRRRPRRRRRRRRRRHNHVVRPTASDGYVGHRRDDRARDNRARSSFARLDVSTILCARTSPTGVEKVDFKL